MLGIAAALVGGGYLYFRLDDEIRRQVERRLADHYKGLTVHVGSAHCEQDRGIAIYDVAISEPARGSMPRPLVLIEEMFLAGQVRIDELLVGQPEIEKIIVHRAKLRATRRLDGTWTVASLLPLPRIGGKCPELVVEDATVSLEDAARPDAAPLVIRDVDLTIAPSESGRHAGSPSAVRHLRGTVTGVPAKEFQCEGRIDLSGGSFDLTITIRELAITPELLATVPGFNAAQLQQADLFGRTDVTLNVRRPSADEPCDWSADVQVDRGRIVHPRLPEPFTGVSLHAKADSRRLVVASMEAKFGAADVTLACERAGWSPNAPIGLSARVIGLGLDEQLESIVPETCVRPWRRFRPRGPIDVELRASFDGRQWQPKITAQCRGIALTDVDKFPYPLEQATGKVEYTAPVGPEPDRFTMDLTAVGAGRPVRIVADLTHLVPERDDSHHPLGWVQITGVDIPLHELLIASLPEKSEALVRALRPQGSIDFRFRAAWQELTQPSADVTKEIRLKDCTIHYTAFPYRLHGVHGLVTEQNRHWTFHDVEGRCGSDSTIVRCAGTTTPRGQESVVDLTFDAENVPLDDNLKLALSPAARLAWDELRPQGQVDFTARVLHDTARSEPAIEVTLRPRGQTVSVEPRQFPYRLEGVGGVAKIEAGRLELFNLSGRHDRTLYSATSGIWQAAGDGGWQLQLSGANVDRFAPQSDRDLLLALPPPLQRMIEQLQPNGSFAIYNSALALSKSPQTVAVSAAWDVNVYAHQASIESGIPLRGVTGACRLVGRNDGDSFYSAGELDLDSLVWKNAQFTNVRGPLWIDPAACLLGEQASQKQAQPPRRVTADAYGGSLTANAALLLGPDAAYQVDAALGGIDLGRFARERLAGPTELSGTVSGRLVVSGAGQSPMSLSGQGELHVVDANLYELPVLMSVLKVLRNRTPSTSAFNQCDMQFVIQGENVYFKQLNLLGDAVSLYGNGETNFNRDLNLVFYTLIGPADLPIPLWRAVAGQVSQQGLQLKVVGKWDAPDVQRKALPAVNDAIQMIQAQIQAGAATMAPSTASRDVIAPTR